MIKEPFSLKFNQFIFLLLLSFPLLHFWGEGRMFLKPVFLIVIGIIGLVFFSKKKLSPSTFLTNLIIQIIVLSFFLQLYFHWEIAIASYIFPLALFLFYKIVMSFLSANENSNKYVSIFRTYISIIGIEILLFIVSKKITFLNFCPNESIFSILIATQLLFITPYLKKIYGGFIKNQKLHKILPICYILLCYSLLFYTKGRAGIIGFTIGLGVLNYSYLKSKVGYLKGLVIAVCLLLLLLNFKSNSSGGRLLIYKVITTQLEPKELITGIGYGKFKAKYNQLQAKYFSKESIDSNEALLANNTYYMFNDPLQLIIETGLIGLIILSFLLIQFFVLFKRNHTLLKEKPVLNGAYSSVICIIISSLFSYPFQITGILLHFLFCIAIITHANKEKKLSEPILILRKAHSIINRTTLLSTAVCLIFFGLVSFDYYIKSNEAIRCSNIGFRKKAIQIYHGLSNECIKDGDILYNYSDELAKVNKIDSALIILHKALNYLNNDKSAVLMGNLLQEKGMFSEAEKQYKKAIFINPKLFTNRASLFKFYYETKQFKKAKFWGNSILKMPVKIPSKTITNIKNETRKLMSDMKNSQS